jgi:hypothetical protein
LCISEKVAGFRLRGAATGDILYLAVHVNNVSYCGAKGVLAEITEQRPWDDAELYKHCLRLKDIEYCKPFDLKVLLKVGGKYWQLKYIQGAKAIVDDEAVRLLETTFSSKRIDKLFEFIQPGLDQQTDEGETGAVEEIVEKVLSVHRVSRKQEFPNSTQQTVFDQGVEAEWKRFSRYSFYPRCLADSL